MLKFYFPWIIHRPHDGGPKHRWLCVRFNGINWIFEKIEKKTRPNQIDANTQVLLNSTTSYFWVLTIAANIQLASLAFYIQFPISKHSFQSIWLFILLIFSNFFFRSLIFLYSTTVAEVVRQLYLSARLTIESSCLLHFNQTIEKTKETKRFWGKLTIRLPFVF